jgi:CheY-like chemotaxis protein
MLGTSNEDLCELPKRETPWSPGGSMPCVLCMDDNRDVLASVAEVLQNSGYSTLTADRGNHVVYKTDFSGLRSALKKLSEESASKRSPT